VISKPPGETEYSVGRNATNEGRGIRGAEEKEKKWRKQSGQERRKNSRNFPEGFKPFMSSTHPIERIYQGPSNQ